MPRQLTPAKEPVTFTRHEIAWLQFYHWLVMTQRVSEFPKIGPN